jgi:hypothetical protein
MSIFTYNPYTLTDDEIFGSSITTVPVSMKAIRSDWLARINLSNLDSIRPTISVSIPSRSGGFGFGGGFGGFGGSSTTSIPNTAGIAEARQKSIQLPAIVKADVDVTVKAMTAIAAAMKTKYSQPTFLGTAGVNRAFGGGGRPIIGPPGGVVAEKVKVLLFLNLMVKLTYIGLVNID